MAKFKKIPPKKPRKNGTVSVQSIQIAKKQKKTEKNYTTEALQLALSSIDKGLSIREAAQKYGVPKTTLHAKLKYESPIDCRKGAPTILSVGEEAAIVQWVLYCAERGFPVTRNCLVDCVQKYVRSIKRQNPFKDDRPGVHWFKGFLNRHPVLTTRIAQKLTTTGANVNEEDLRNWFKTIKSHFEEKNLLSLTPERILNLDESAFMLNPDDNVVLAEKGAKSVYKIIGANEKATVTVLFIAAASGEILPPMILFDTKKPLRKHILAKLPKDWSVGYTERGSMTAETYFNYIKNVLYKWLVQHEYEFPVILYVDGHKSHVSMPLVQFCMEKGIEMIALFPNATHIIQPLDIAFFSPFKQMYRQCHWKWRLDNHVIQFQKYMVAVVIQQALESKDFADSIKSGFRAAGLCPLDADAVNYNTLNKHKIKTGSNSADEPIDETSTEVCQTEDSAKQFLQFFERKIIPSETLQLFKQHDIDHEWSGDVSKTDLYVCWKKMTVLSGQKLSSML